MTKEIIQATKLVTAFPISPVESPWHDNIIAAVIDKEYPDKVTTILLAYGHAITINERYWANVIAALLIRNHDRALALAREIEVSLRNLHDDERAKLLPMVMIGMLEAANWMLQPGNPANTRFLKEVADTFGMMFARYATAVGIGVESCSDWVAGAFSSNINTYLEELEHGNRYVACETIVGYMQKITTIRLGAIRLFDELSYKLFRQLTWPQKQRALRKGFESREQCVPTEA
jgi:hypothetical protein